VILRKNEFSASENEFFRKITKKIEVVTSQGGKNSGSLLSEWFSNVAKMLIGLFSYAAISMEKSLEKFVRGAFFWCRVRNFRHFLLERV
jgi:hypothetical protein